MSIAITSKSDATEPAAIACWSTRRARVPEICIPQISNIEGFTNSFSISARRSCYSATIVMLADFLRGFGMNSVSTALTSLAAVPIQMTDSDGEFHLSSWASCIYLMNMTIWHMKTEFRLALLHNYHYYCPVTTSNLWAR